MSEDKGQTVKAGVQFHDLPLPEFPRLRKWGAAVEPWVDSFSPIFEPDADLDAVDWSKPYRDPKCIGACRRFICRITGYAPMKDGERQYWTDSVVLYEEEIERNREHLDELIRVKAEVAELSVLHLLGEM